MTKPVRIGVVGAGIGQRVHVPAFRADARCCVVALCTSDYDRAAAAAQRLQVPHAYGSVGDMLAAGDIDAVSIGVPPLAQPEIISACARAGKHVFCEKPLATTEQAAARAVEAVKNARVVHAVDFIFPEIVAWQRARSILESGSLGTLRHAAVSWRVETYAHATRRDSWKVRCAEGGGTLNNFVSHSFYYLEWLLGPIACLAARLTPRGAAGDARVDAWLEFESGHPASLSVAADAFLGSGHRLEFYGESGTLVLENRAADYVNGFTLAVGIRDSDSFVTQPPEPFPFEDGRIGAAAAIVRRFVDSMDSGAPVTPDLSDAARVQHLIAAARAANETGNWQSV